ncbi:MAG: class I SAM-dependent methyltransferase [Elusimicrobia bacterium]|nr:class I SAM-dependent methyltransferase [Elusimicrobiota bacterium]
MSAEKSNIKNSNESPEASGEIGIESTTTKPEMRYGKKEAIMNWLSDFSLVDRTLVERANDLVDKSGIEKYINKDGLYLDIGAGKGHIPELLEYKMAENGGKGRVFGIDLADKPTKKVQERAREKRDMGSTVKSKDKNAAGFMFGEAQYLPIADKSLDGVTFFFSSHYLDDSNMNKAFEEAKRVIKEGGHILIVEDIPETKEERENNAEFDKKVNWLDEEIEYNYKSKEEWKQYLEEQGLEIVEESFFEEKTKQGVVKHASYVLRLKE